LAIGLLLLPIGLRAAPLQAIVHLRPENPPAERRGYAFLVNGVLPIAPPLHDPRQDALLVLEPIDGTPPRPLPPGALPPVEVRIYGARAIPTVIAVSTPGPTVSFHNEDRRPLRLACPQTGELVPSASLEPGGRLVVTPSEAGEFELTSPDLPHFQATLLVSRGYVSRFEWSPLGEVGVARLDLPPGSFRARLFFHHRYLLEQTVSVTSDGAELMLRPSLTPPADRTKAVPTPPSAGSPPPPPSGSTQGVP
jgi:hypothetical protein